MSVKDKFIILRKQILEESKKMAAIKQKLDKAYFKNDFILGVIKQRLEKLSYEDLNYIINLYDEAEKKGNIIGFHFLKEEYGLKPNYKSVLEDGIVNNSGPDITQTVTLNNDYFHLLLNISAEMFTSSDGQHMKAGAIIVEIPKHYINPSDKQVKPIYKLNSGVPTLLPEYIKSYIPHEKGKMLLALKIDNTYYKEIHNYSNEGLLFDQGVIIAENKR